jgi:hypothetical protein
MTTLQGGKCSYKVWMQSFAELGPTQQVRLDFQLVSLNFSMMYIRLLLLKELKKVVNRRGRPCKDEARSLSAFEHDIASGSQNTERMMR